jgi:predicted helicase
MSDFYNHEKSYTKEKRREFGIWYTPIEIVDCIVNNVNQILKNEFDEEHGLASENIELLDFAAGTGVFIYRAAEKALQENKSDNEILDIIQENYQAYEIDPDSFDILVNNLESLFKSYRKDFNRKNILNVDTLSNRVIAKDCNVKPKL